MTNRPSKPHIVGVCPAPRMGHYALHSAPAQPAGVNGHIHMYCTAISHVSSSSCTHVHVYLPTCTCTLAIAIEGCSFPQTANRKSPPAGCSDLDLQMSSRGWPCSCTPIYMYMATIATGASSWSSMSLLRALLGQLQRPIARRP